MAFVLFVFKICFKLYIKDRDLKKRVFLDFVFVKTFVIPTCVNISLQLIKVLA